LAGNLGRVHDDKMTSYSSLRIDSAIETTSERPLVQVFDFVW